MFAYEVEGKPPYDEHPAAIRNIVDNPLYSHDSWSTGANPSFHEQLLPPVQPGIITATTDKGEQYVNLFAQPPVLNRPPFVGGKIF